MFNVCPSEEELKRKSSWVADAFLKDTLPFTFDYDNVPFSELVIKWSKNITETILPDGRKSIIIVFTSIEQISVRCEITEYLEDAACEWTIYIKNNGNVPSKPITAFKGINTTFFQPPFVLGNYSNSPKLFTLMGDTGAIDTYQPMQYFIRRPLHFESIQGRSTCCVFPYYRIDCINQGMFFAFSWQGQWACDIHIENGIHISGGQQLLSTYLLPDEEIRSPLSLVLFYDGFDETRSTNLWRRWFIKYNVPKEEDNNLLRHYVLAYPGNPGLKIKGRSSYELEETNEASILDYCNKMIQNYLPVDYLWLDAGWYELNGNKSWWMGVGTWRADHVRFPNGLNPIADELAQHGIKILLWYEPLKNGMNVKTFLTVNIIRSPLTPSPIPSG